MSENLITERVCNSYLSFVSFCTCYNHFMADKEPKRRMGRDEVSATPKFKSTKSKSSRELFYLAIALASLVRLAMHFIQR